MKTRNGKIPRICVQKKQRKVVKGPIRDASKTKELILDAFAEILAEKI